MTSFLCFLRPLLLAQLVITSWLAAEQAAEAQVLLAQSGAAKTGVGYGLFFLALILGLLVVCRPSRRQWQYSEEELRQQQAKKQGQVRR